MCIDILKFNNFKISQLCKLYLIYIVTCMCCNHCNISVMTYLKAMGQGHILTYNLKVHNLEGTKFGKFSRFISVDTKNWCPWDFKGFMINWIFAGTYWTFRRWSKTPKKGRGILVSGTFYPFLFVSILCCFISWEPFNIFSWNFAQLFLV